MHLNPVALALLSAYSVSALTLRQRRSNDQSLNWNEAAEDFKAIIKAITFGEGFPKHQDGPLQVIPKEQPHMELFILAAEGMSPASMNHVSMAKKSPRVALNPWMAKAKRSPSNSALSQEDLLLLNFLASQEEPSQLVQADLKRANQRYQSIISERKKSKKEKMKKLEKEKKIKKEKKMYDFQMDSKKGSKKMNSKPAKPAKSTKPSKSTKPFKPNKPTKPFLSRLDLKGARNKLTISVAFAVIVTALFCVVIQLFRLFSRPSRGFEQINRRSGAVGYERIALDVDEEDEAMPLNNA